MTCIVGLVNKKDKSVIIGADSAGVSDWDISVRKDPKVFFVGDFLIGCTSSFRMIQLLMYSLEIPKIGNTELFKFMCTDFVNAIRTCFESGGYLQKSDTGEDKGGTFLVGYKSRLFRIDSDFQVGELVNGIDAIGVGKNYSLGSLFSTKFTNLTPEQRVTQALEAACEFSMGVTKPLVILETKSQTKRNKIKLPKTDSTIEHQPSLQESIFDVKNNKPGLFPEGVYAQALNELPIGKVVVIQISPALYNQKAKDILNKLGHATDRNLCVWGRINSHFEDQSVSVLDQFGGLRGRTLSEISLIRGLHEGYLSPNAEPSFEFFDLSLEEKYTNV